MVQSYNYPSAGTGVTVTPLQGDASNQNFLPITVANPLPVTVVSGTGDAVTIADGADVAEGAIADAVVAAGAAGTVSAKLRRLTTDIGALILQIPASLGIKTSALSLSVAPASDAVFQIAATRGGAYTDRSIANLAGTSETLMASNTSRRILIVTNEGATALAVNLTGGTAALNTAGSVTIQSGGNLVLDTYPPTSAITIIGTLNADVSAYEG